MASFQDRLIGAIRLQPATFEDVEHDASATGQAAGVVALSAVAGGFVGFWWGGLGHIAFTLVVQLIGWVIGAYVLLIVGTKLLPGKNTEADFGQMLRTSGFAQAAGIFGIVGIVPFVGFLLSLLVGIWVLVAMVVAVRQALDYDDTIKAVIVCVVAWVIMWVAVAIAGAVGIGGAMMTSSVM